MVTSSLAADTTSCNWQRWEKAIARFAAQDQQQPPPHDEVLFVGSSSIRFWDLPKYYPQKKYINRGFGGSQICDSTHFIDTLVLKNHPRVVVLYAGDNDIAAGKSPDQVALDFREFVQAIHAVQKNVKIVFICIKPSTARWKMAKAMQQANALIAKECEQEPRLEYVDIWQPMLGSDGQPRKELLREDGLHLTHAGYLLWSQLIASHLVSQPPQP